MSASRARRIAVAIVTSFSLLLGIAPGATAAGPQLQLPDTMAAVGDSITQAASTAGSLGADAPQNSWSTGWSTGIQSHYLRLLAAGAPIGGRNFNHSVSGAKMVHLAEQMATLQSVQPDYLTVLMGGNDLCTPTVGDMTSVTAFRTQFESAMATLANVSPNTKVFVVSIPDVYQLWNLFKGNWWARFVWSVGAVCQSLLANPTSTQQADVQRRAAVRQRNIDFNLQLAQVCAAHSSRCHFDGNAAFNTKFTTADVSGDYFHPSAAGQAKLADVSWAAGYSWVAAPPENQAPVASFDVVCTHLACDFTDTSSDDAAVVSWAWDFGDGSTATGATPSHAYASPGTFEVTLTAADAEGVTDTATESVTVTAAPQNQSPVAAFSASCIGLACEFTDGSSDADGSIVARGWSFGDGASSSATNPTHTFGSAGTYTVSLTVTDDDGAAAETSRTVTVEEAPAAPIMGVASLVGSGDVVNKNTWRATVTILVADEDGTPIANASVTGTWTPGSADTCTTGSDGRCSVSSDNLSRRNVSSVNFSVSDVSHATHVYDSTLTPQASVTVIRP